MKKDVSGKSRNNSSSDKEKPDNSVKIAIIGAVVTVATTLITAIFAPVILEKIKEPASPPIQSSNTATPFFDTTSTAQATSSNVIYNNDFNNGNGHWFTGDTNDSSRTMKQFVIDGAYNWEIIHYGDFSSFYYPSDIPILSNFEVSTDIKISSSEIVEDAYFCLQIRSGNNNYYSFGVMPLRGVYLAREHEYKDGQDIWVSLPGNGNISPAVNQYDFNRLKIIAKGENLTFYINDVLVADIVDDRLKSGSIGLDVYVPENILTKFIIDNFQVIQLP